MVANYRKSSFPQSAQTLCLVFSMCRYFQKRIALAAVLKSSANIISHPWKSQACIVQDYSIYAIKRSPSLRTLRLTGCRLPTKYIKKCITRRKRNTTIIKRFVDIQCSSRLYMVRYHVYGIITHTAYYGKCGLVLLSYTIPVQWSTTYTEVCYL